MESLYHVFRKRIVPLFAFLLLASGVCVDLHAVGQVVEKVTKIVEKNLSEQAAFKAYEVAQTNEDRIAALEVLEPLAEEGDLSAILVVGGHYTMYPSGEEDAETAFKLYLKGTKHEDPTCLLLVGIMYGAGEGVEPSFENAMSYLDRAIAAGSPKAYKAKAHLLLKPDTFEEAEALLLKASELGVVDANVYLGEIYHYGEFSTPDYEAALSFYKKAMDGGDAYSSIVVGDYYRDGTSGVKDVAQAHAAFTRAKDLGEPRAWNRLGKMYLYGEYVSFDVKLAAAYFKKGTEVGDRESMVWLGLAYSFPGADFENTEECYLWTYVSAEMGIESVRDSNQELAGYLGSKVREELEAKADRIVASLKEQ